jgi:hypothetical protein
MSKFADAITQAQALAVKKRERDLSEHLRVHGIPEAHDLGAMLAVREMFHDVSVAAFDRITKAVEIKQGE